MCELVMMDREEFENIKSSIKQKYPSTLVELMDIMNEYRDMAISQLEILGKKTFSSTQEFKMACVEATHKKGREITEKQRILLRDLVEMDSAAINKTYDYIVNLEDNLCDDIINFCNTQREVKMGHLLKVLAFCDFSKGQEVLLNIMIRFEPTVCILEGL